MLATSWKAEGLVLPVWQRLDVPKGKREELGRLTGIPPTNLSGMNKGRLAMTPETADKIIQAVPGISLADLGAPEKVIAAATPTILSRLAELEEEGLALTTAVTALFGVAQILLEQVEGLGGRIPVGTLEALDQAMPRTHREAVPQ